MGKFADLYVRGLIENIFIILKIIVFKNIRIFYAEDYFIPLMILYCNRKFIFYIIGRFALLFLV